MAHYSLDDPRLQADIERRAADTAAAWPTPDEQQLATLARLLPPPPAAAKPARRAPNTSRRPTRTAA